MFEGLKRRACSRTLEAGDVVRVSGVNNPEWENWNHPIGGDGTWGTYVRGRYMVRPLYSDGTTGRVKKVDQVVHIDDAINEAAIELYYKTKGAKRRR